MNPPVAALPFCALALVVLVRLHAQPCTAGGRDAKFSAVKPVEGPLTNASLGSGREGQLRLGIGGMNQGLFTQKNNTLVNVSGWNSRESSTPVSKRACPCSASLTNLQVLNALLYVAEQGCKWPGLPKRFGRRHTNYMHMNRWAKSVVLDRVFAQLQIEQIFRIKIEAFSLESTSVKVHPDGTGALHPRDYEHALDKKRNEIDASSAD